MAIIKGYRLKPKFTAVITVMILLSYALGLFASELGLSEANQGYSFCISIIGSCFLILPKVNVWQKVDEQ